jgi:hypothetical protein
LLHGNVLESLLGIPRNILNLGPTASKGRRQLLDLSLQTSRHLLVLWEADGKTAQKLF